MLTFLDRILNDGTANMRGKNRQHVRFPNYVEYRSVDMGICLISRQACASGHSIPAYTFGLRHAVDADHIAAIDNVTRKLMQESKRPIAVGFFFSMGHSLVLANRRRRNSTNGCLFGGSFQYFQR